MNSHLTQPNHDRAANSAQTESVSRKLVSPASPESDWFGLRSGDRLVIAVLATVVLVLTSIQWLRLTAWGQRPLEIERLPERTYDFRIDINQAGVVEWTQIEGIGDKTAQAIIDDRTANGPFRSVDDLVRVRGIGRVTLEEMRPYLREVAGTTGSAEKSKDDKPKSK